MGSGSKSLKSSRNEISRGLANLCDKVIKIKRHFINQKLSTITICPFSSLSFLALIRLKTICEFIRFIRASTSFFDIFSNSFFIFFLYVCMYFQHRVLKYIQYFCSAWQLVYALMALTREFFYRAQKFR